MSSPTYWSQPNQQVVRDGVPVAAGTNDPDPELAAAGFDPGEHTVADVKAYVDDNPAEVAAVLAAEQAGKARATLIEWLEADDDE